jgi:hypothetical protein
MSDPAKRVVRIVLGLVLGLIGGIALGIYLLVLVVFVCRADGGTALRKPNHEWVYVSINIATVTIVVLAPLLGCAVGLIWTTRRNRRGETE